MPRERESKDSFHGLWGVQVGQHATLTHRHYIPFPKGLAAPNISEAVVRFETISDLKDDLKEILFSIF